MPIDLCIQDENLQDKTVPHYVAVVQVPDYTLEDIIENDLYTLLPFYLFRFANQLVAIEEDEKRLEELADLYSRIRQHIDKSMDEGKITEYDRHLLVDAIQNVAAALAAGQPNIQGKVVEQMQMPVMDFEAKRIRDAGIEIGFAKGHTAGLAEGRIEQHIETSREFNASNAQILDGLQKKFGLTLKQAQEKLQKYTK